MSSPNPFPITIVNNSGSKSDVHITIKGMNAAIANNKNQQFYNLTTKTWSQEAVSLNIGTAKETVIDIPSIESGIVYLSFGSALEFANRISPPNIGNPSDPSFNVVYDKFEISFLPSDGFPYIDITNVDFFCVPLQLQEKLPNGTTNGPKGFATSRKAIFKSFSDGLTGHWEKIIQTPIDKETGKPKETIRIIAPNKALVSNDVLDNDFDASSFQNYIDAVWDFYAEGKGKSVAVDMSEIAAFNPGYENVVFEGIVKDGEFVFSEKGGSGSLPSISFAKPSGNSQIKGSVFGCEDVFAAPNKTPRSVPAKNLGAAFNVGILAHPNIEGNTLFLMPPTTKTQKEKNWTTYRCDYYTNTMTLKDGTVLDCFNVYSKCIHENAIDSDDYGFAFDDVTQSDSTLADKDAIAAIVTIQNIEL
ncbi:beta-1,3-glucanase family protein [Kordia jejudonensis]|uniref:beta-1,3-glucanase family protein n=1 Tax=Kordia jejudonensis TaxID=1348245 RepID=UPI000629509E|nr:beta-1,3-glucanase family protein [Kordia jejudonensis]